MKKHLFSFVVVLLFVYAFAVEADLEPVNYKARLTGHGFSASLNFDVVISGVQVGESNVHGETIIHRDIKADIVEVIPPINNDYWCINSIVRNISGIDGYNWIWFIKDIPSGDELSFASGMGLTCDNVGAPVQLFEVLTGGDFKGDIKYF